VRPDGHAAPLPRRTCTFTNISLIASPTSCAALASLLLIPLVIVTSRRSEPPSA
jgi:hypothetical protein